MSVAVDTKQGLAPGAVQQPLILVVEDEELIRMSTVDLLQDAGFRTDEARTGGEAMARLDARGACLAAAVIDLGLPDRGGDGMVTDVRARLPVLPIVVASGQLDAELAHRFKDDAYVAVVGKPYDGATLVGALRRLLAP